MTTTKINRETKITAEPGKQELFITREFDAPRDLVFRAFSEPELMQQWIGCDDLKMHIVHMEYKDGGAYRYIMKDGAGNEYGFNGAIHEVTAPERIIQTFEFEGLPERGHVAMETSTFEALPGNKTRVVIQSVLRSVADRDGLIASGMENGAVQSHNRLDELLEQGF